MNRYFKLVCVREGRTDWLLNEYNHDRIRFGWSWPGSDLRKIEKKEYSDMSDDERVTWRYTQFLLYRIQPGDRAVLQFEQPLRKFLIAAVNGPYEYAAVEEDDFNHILPCKPLTPDFIDIESSIVSKSLRHDLSKRGHYYQIYPDESIRELEEITNLEKWKSPEYSVKSSQEIELERTHKQIAGSAVRTIARRWKGKDFEEFVSVLLRRIPGVEVKSWGDPGKGWDLLARIIDPLSGEILYDDIPVQCKNYEGRVETRKPIEDLERSAQNTQANLFYLIITGDVSQHYLEEISRKEQDLSAALGRTISFRVITEDRIAELYLQSGG